MIAVKWRHEDAVNFAVSLVATRPARQETLNGANQVKYNQFPGNDTVDIGPLDSRLYGQVTAAPLGA